MNTNKSSSSLGVLLAAATGLALTFANGTARAEAPQTDGPPTVTVSYAGLDLSTRAGAETLYRRIKGASEQVCSAFEGRPLQRVALWRRCYEQAVANAVAEVHRPALTALHQSHSPANAGG